MNRWMIALASLLFPVVFSAFYFGSAGRVDLWPAWGVTAVLTVFGLASAAWVDRGLIAERVKPKGANRDQTGQRIASVLLLVHWIVAGLDAGRYGWSLIPTGVRWAGAAGYAVAMVLLFWAVRVNSFYSSAVRVQADRDQFAVATGPYRFVRHPGYAATILGAVSGGLALGSWTAMVPLLGMAGLFVRRTHNEDRMLGAELPGYAEYALRVRHRLLPGVY